MHNHEHNQCDHDLKYCPHCDVVYCTKCNREWGKERVVFKTVEVEKEKPLKGTIITYPPVEISPTYIFKDDHDIDITPIVTCLRAHSHQK